MNTDSLPHDCAVPVSYIGGLYTTEEVLGTAGNFGNFGELVFHKSNQ